jgi:hypothetical protein
VRFAGVLLDIDGVVCCGQQVRIGAGCVHMHVS